jgi:hypothetical protein
MSTPIGAARYLALTALLGVVLAACALPGQQPPAQPQATGAGETPLAGQSYPPPGTATVAIPSATAQAGTTPTVEGTAVAPTAAAPAATTPVAGLLGPEWTVAYSGDLNLDGRADAIGWVPAQGVPKGPTFGQAQYARYVGPASQIVIVHASADNRPQVQFLGTGVELRAGSTLLASFDAARRPVGFMLNVNPSGTPSLLDLIQVNGSGEPMAQGIGIRWDAASQAYRIVGAAGK